MADPIDAAHYKALIDKAQSYHDLVIIRSRFFGLLERSLPSQEYLAIKDLWHAKARDESLPVAPPKAAGGD